MSGFGCTNVDNTNMSRRSDCFWKIVSDFVQ